MPRKIVKTIIPNDTIFRFEVKARREGSKGDGLRITIPSAITRGLRHLDWDQRWIHLKINHGAPCLVIARIQGASLVMALPKYARGDVAINDRVSIEARNPASMRCEPGPLISDAGVDWTAVLPGNVIALDEGDVMAVHTRYEPAFRMRRVTPIAETFWLLGFYQAEGSKKGFNEWLLVNKTPALIAHTIECLEAMGINRSRLYFEITRGAKQSDAVACAPYENMGVELRHCRQRSVKGKGGYEACIMHLRSSKPLARMTVEILRRIIEGGLVGELPREAARAYAIGWLDGDGSITIAHQRQAWLRAFGTATECEATRVALNRGFDWTLTPKKYKNASEGMLWSLDASRAATLALEHAFRGQQSRVRLLEIVAYVASRLVTETTGLWKRWGYRDDLGGLTTKGERFLNNVAALTAETNAHRAAGRAVAMGVVGRKGL